MVGAVRATATCAVGILRLIGPYGSSFRLRFYLFPEGHIDPERPQKAWWPECNIGPPAGAKNRRFRAHLMRQGDGSSTAQASARAQSSHQAGGHGPRRRIISAAPSRPCVSRAECFERLSTRSGVWSSPPLHRQVRRLARARANWRGGRRACGSFLIPITPQISADSSRTGRSVVKTLIVFPTIVGSARHRSRRRSPYWFLRHRSPPPWQSARQRRSQVYEVRENLFRSPLLTP